MKKRFLFLPNSLRFLPAPSLPRSFPTYLLGACLERGWYVVAVRTVRVYALRPPARR